ncbi:MAG: hypothetical protein Q4F65_12375, partial [Propionibacteriaceae bacterium]|nr:hypothetical protein [Propionibacteriaceae bacterium]
MLSLASVVGPSAMVEAPVAGRFSRARSAFARGPLHALVTDAAGGVVRHWVRTQERPDRAWTRGEAVSVSAGGPGALVVVGGVLQAFVPEVDGTIAHLRLSGDEWGRVGVVARGSAVAATVSRGSTWVAVQSGGGAPDADPCADVVTLWRADGARWVREHTVAGRSPALSTPEASTGFLVEQNHRWVLHARTNQRWLPVCSGPAGTAPASLVAEKGGWLVAVPHGDRVVTHRIRHGQLEPHATLTWGAGRVDGVALLRSGKAVLALTSEEGSVFQHRRHGAESAWDRVA